MTAVASATGLAFRRCPAQGCTRWVKGHLAFCTVHWACLPPSHKRAVVAAMRSAGGNPNAASCHQSISEAVKSIVAAQAPSKQPLLPGVRPHLRGAPVPVEELEAAAARFGDPPSPATAADIERRRSQERCDAFNLHCPVGTIVQVVLSPLRTITGPVTAPAQVLPTGPASVWVAGVRRELREVQARP